MVYEASSKQCLVDGIKSFLDNSVVLPTGQRWDEDVLAPVIRRIIAKQQQESKEKDVIKQG